MTRPARILFAASIAAFALTARPASVRAEDVYWSTRDLLKEFFKSSERVTYVEIKTQEAKNELEALLGYRPKKDRYVVFVARSGDHVDGYAVIDEELGQHLPITFGVKLDPRGLVERMEVMVYREGYGAEIREKRFREQFAGKGADDALRFGQDVMAISGATISSKAMAVGIRRAVALVSLAKKTSPTAGLAGAPGTDQPRVH